MGDGRRSEGLGPQAVPGDVGVAIRELPHVAQGTSNEPPPCRLTGATRLISFLFLLWLPGNSGIGSRCQGHGGREFRQSSPGRRWVL